MLYDPKWNSPVETKPLEPWRQALLDAAQYIRDHGWCQGLMEAPDGRVCVNGAVSVSDKWSTEDLMGFNCPSHTAIRAYDELTKFLGEQDPSVFQWGPSAWNDEKCRVVGEVIAALEGAARS